MTTPQADGFYMPAEWCKHFGTIIIFPQRDGSWIYGGKAAKAAFTRVISAISAGEFVFVAVNKENVREAESYLSGLKNVKILTIPTNDSWARDTAPTFVTDGSKVRGIDWRFNAYGGDYDGLYADFAEDDAFASAVCKKLGYKMYSARPFVLEGGSVHTDGAGTAIVTCECLLSAGRNPDLTREEIEEKLKTFLGVRRVIWLPYGIEGDETNGHVDNICAFFAPNRVLHAWSLQPSQRRRCEKNIEVLEQNGIEVVKVPQPARAQTVTEYELKGYRFAEGEAVRTVGEQLAASYINFYVCNAAVIVPQFGDENDGAALKIIGGCFPDRKIVGIPARDILLGGGNIHCITQQIPAGGKI